MIKGKVTLEVWDAELIDGEWVPVKLANTINKTNKINYIRLEQFVQEATYTTNTSNNFLWISEYPNEGPDVV